MGTSARLHRPEIVILSHEELAEEVRRVAAVASLLPPGKEGHLKLKPFLHFRQCWHVINQLKLRGFSVKASGELDSFGHTLFLPDSEGALGVKFYKRAGAAAAGGETARGRHTRQFIEPGILEKLALDRLESKHEAVVGKKKPASDPRNALNSVRVKQLLSGLVARPFSIEEMPPPTKVPRRFREAKAASRKESKSQRLARIKGSLKD